MGEETPELVINLRPMTPREERRFSRRFRLAAQLGDMRVLGVDGRVLTRWKGQRGLRRLWTLARMWRGKWLP